ncbi:fibronectin type III domain-containing protein, partial [archaeon]
DTLVVEWQPPASERGAPITGYVLVWHDTSLPVPLTCGDGNFTSCPVVAADASSATLRSLQAGHTHSVRVLSMNARGLSLGDGATSLALPVCPQGVVGCTPALVPRRLPRAPTLLTVSAPGTSNIFTHTSLRATWASGDESTNVPNTRYMVEWDTLPSFSSRADGRPLSYDEGTAASPHVAHDPQVSEYVYDITGLSAGTPYYIRVTATNTLGYGEATAVTRAKPFGAPSLAREVELGTLSLADASVTTRQRGTSLAVTFMPPADDGGDAVTSYRVLWSTQPFQQNPSSSHYEPAVQALVLTAAGGLTLRGTFRLTLDTSACALCFVRGVHMSPRIPVAASAEELRVALESMPNIASTRVTVDASPTTPGSSTLVWLRTWQVTFTTDMGPMPQLSTDVSGIVATGFVGAPPTAGVDYAVIHDSVSEVTGVPPDALCGSASMAACGVVTPTLATNLQFTYVITNLLPGVTYYAAVVPLNTLGAATFEVTQPLGLAPPRQAPDAPTSPYNPRARPVLTVLSHGLLRVAYAPAAFDGGSAVTRYKVEWDTQDTFDSTPANGGPAGWVEMPAPGSAGHVVPSAHQEYTLPVPPGAYNVTRYAPPSPGARFGYAAAPSGTNTLLPLTMGVRLFVRVSAQNAAGLWSASALA